MKKSRIVARKIETSSGENPNLISVLASTDSESVEIVFETVQAPVLAAGVLRASQTGVKKMSRKDITDGMAKNLAKSMEALPEAVDISLAVDGEILCINVGSGAIFFRLTEPAKRAINKPLKNIEPL